MPQSTEKFVLLKYLIFTLYPSEVPDACLILEKHVRLLFDEGNILLTAWLQDLHVSIY